jgi:hypothetical protein
MAQEIVPHLKQEKPRYSFPQLSTFSRVTAMGVNGTGDLAQAWSTNLEKLTARSDLSTHVTELGRRSPIAWASAQKACMVPTLLRGMERTRTSSLSAFALDDPDGSSVPTTPSTPLRPVSTLPEISVSHHTSHRCRPVYTMQYLLRGEPGRCTRAWGERLPAVGGECAGGTAQ